jgi:hypothetical protein
MENAMTNWLDPEDVKAELPKATAAGLALGLPNDRGSRSIAILVLEAIAELPEPTAHWHRACNHGEECQDGVEFRRLWLIARIVTGKETP